MSSKKNLFRNKIHLNLLMIHINTRLNELQTLPRIKKLHMEDTALVTKQQHTGMPELNTLKKNYINKSRTFCKKICQQKYYLNRIIKNKTEEKLEMILAVMEFISYMCYESGPGAWGLGPGAGGRGLGAGAPRN